MKKVLVTNYVHPILLTGLEKLGYAVVYDKDYDPINLDVDLPELAGIVINTKIKMTAERIDKSPKLEFIARLGSGLEIIDISYAESKGIQVINSPEGNRNAVAEHALGMLLCLANNIKQGDREVRSKVWNRESNRGFELEGKTIGIVGMGNTGQAFARKLSGWALELIYNDPYLLDKPKDLFNIESVNITQLQQRADIISFHVPLTMETQGMVNNEFIKACKPGVIIINTSRGKVIDTAALVSAIETGIVTGACLDVYENEKPHTFSTEEDHLYNRMYALSQVVLSPHVAGWTHESLQKIAEVLLDKISAPKSKRNV